MTVASGIIIPLLIRYIWLLLRYHHAHKREQFVKGQLPPQYPLLIPIVGAVRHLWQDHAGFLQRFSTYGGRLTSNRVNILGTTYYNFQDRETIEKIFKASTLSSSIDMYGWVNSTLLGASTKAMGVYRKDDSGPFPQPHPKSNIAAHNRIDHITHHGIFRGLTGPGLHPTTVRYTQDLCRRMQALNIGEDWVDMPDLAYFFKEVVGSGTLNAVVGPTMLQLNPTFVQDMFKFDKIFPSFAPGFPRFMMRESYAFRDRLVDCFKKWYRYANRRFDESMIDSDGDGDPIWGSAMMRQRQKALLAVDNHDEDTVARLDLGLAWSAIGNVVPSCMFAIFHIFNDGETLRKARAEVREIFGGTSFEDVDIAKLNKSAPLLSSIYAETLRLYIKVYSLYRSPHEEVQLGKWTLPRGGIAVINSGPSHMDSTFWNTKDGKHPVDTFWPSRFIVDPADPRSGPVSPDHRKQINTKSTTDKPYFSMDGCDGAWIPFGGGHSMCPGRFFAKSVMIFTFALLVSNYDIETHVDKLTFTDKRNVAANYMYLLRVGVTNTYSGLPFDMSADSQDPAFSEWLALKRSYDRLRFGVCFRNLHVYGLNSGHRAQATVASWVHGLPRYLIDCLSSRAKPRVQILQDFNGLICRDTHGIYISQDSDISYEGLPYLEMNSTLKGERIYVAEADVHFPELTLGQTLKFAALTQESGKDRQPRASKLARHTATVLGLDSAIDTWVGNATIRGISGGEKRRTSIAEGILSSASFQCWDNSTRGLDSSTALKFVNTLRKTTIELQITAAMSIYQASDSIYEVLTIWAQRPIVEKHNRYALYHPFTDAAASMICDLPNKFLTAMLFQIALYFMSNLRRTPSAFFIWFLFNFLLVLNMSMWFRFVGSISRTMAQSTAPTCIMVLLSCIYSGFVVQVPYMVGWLAWFRFVNPISYAYESLMINEFRNRNFQCVSMVPAASWSSRTPTLHQTCAVVGAISGQTFVRGEAYLIEKYTYVSSHIWRQVNFGILSAMTVIVCIMHLLAAEFVPAERSKGDVLRFKSSIGSRKRLPTDEESHELVNLPQATTGRARTCDDSHLAPSRTESASSFLWRGLSYDVRSGQNNSKRILDCIDGWVKPGTMTALMGVTGAGKTTLLDVLANRATSGTRSGSIFLNGKSRGASFQRKMGYAQQEDIHLATTTVREALEFSAFLRQSNTSTSKKLAGIDRVIGLLEMESYCDAIVGISGDGLNIEQRKRLTIAVEMVAQPEFVLFLDEPTSGLDSQTAWSICRLLRKLADNGQAVLCTIHQPSSPLLAMFDRLLLLSPRGQTIYFGEIGSDFSTMISYFERNGAEECESNASPAEWVLGLSTQSTSGCNFESPSGNWAEKWSTSSERGEMLEEIKMLEDTRYAETGVMEGLYASTWPHQLSIVLRRTLQEYWRNPVYLYSKFALGTGVALFNGLSFQNTRLDLQGMQNLIFSMFLHTQMFGTMDQQIIPQFIQSRRIFEARESRSRTYSWAVFVTSHIVVELLWQTMAAVLIFIAWYYPTGIWRNGDAEFGTEERGALSFIIILLYCLWISTFSQAVAAGIEQEESAVQAATLIFWFSLVFCGVVVPPGDLPGFWKFVWRASPLTYLINGLAVAGLYKAKISCSAVQLIIVNPPSGISCEAHFAQQIDAVGGLVLNPEATSGCEYCPITDANSFLYETLEAVAGNPWKIAGYLCVFVAFNIVATYGLYWVARVPRRT
ncbi:ABC multidrug transporter A-2 [Paramyrothecium foliicola]|nr:ABC multidrug transporter A-2 [Paramyrothecium foliicola]